LVAKYKFMCRQDRQGVWGPLKDPSVFRAEPWRVVRGAMPHGAQRFLGF